MLMRQISSAIQIIQARSQEGRGVWTLPETDQLPEINFQIYVKNPKFLALDPTEIPAPRHQIWLRTCL